MTDTRDNPLLRKNAGQHLCADPHSIAARYNANRKRKDAIWVANATGGLVLADTPEFTECNTRRIAEKREKERQDWKRRNRFDN